MINWVKIVAFVKIFLHQIMLMSQYSMVDLFLSIFRSIGFLIHQIVYTFTLHLTSVRGPSGRVRGIYGTMLGPPDEEKWWHGMLQLLNMRCADWKDREAQDSFCMRCIGTEWGPGSLHLWSSLPFRVYLQCLFPPRIFQPEEDDA